MDEHNGRVCVTPEYPEGTYAYFATVDENWVSAYPYVVGPTFYGMASNRKVNTISETTTVYTPAITLDIDNDGYNSDIDCNDEDAAINPEAEEIVNNEVDENCDGNVEMMTSIEDAPIEKLNIFPSPANDFITLQASGLVRQSININVFDNAGRLMKNTQIDQGSTMCVIDVRSFYSGKYIVKIQEGNKVYTQSLIIIKD